MGKSSISKGFSKVISGTVKVRLYTGCFKTAAPLKLFGIFLLWLSFFCVKFCKFVGNSKSFRGLLFLNTLYIIITYSPPTSEE